MKSFFKLVKYEIMKVFRNKVVLFMLMSFSVMLLLLMSFSTGTNTSVDFGVYTDGIPLSECEVVSIIEENLGEQNFTQYSDIEKGINDVSLMNIDIFILVDNSSSPVKYKIYYDATNAFSSAVVNQLKGKSDNIVQDVIFGGLKDIGFNIDKSYFEVISFESSNKTKIVGNSAIFPSLMVVAISIVLTFGLSYSMTRDNETNTIKNILYMPMGTNRYLFTKMVPYLLLGLIDVLLSLLIGFTLYNINYQTNIFLIILVSMIFVSSMINLGLLISQMKSQISTAIVAILIILYPLFATFTNVTRSFPIVLQYILYLLPGLAYAPLLSGMIFNGVVIWWLVLILLIDVVIYYLISLLVLHKRVNR